MRDNYRITRQVPRDPAEEYVHDPLFRVDRRDNALNFNPHANNYVKVVDDRPFDDWDAVFASAATSILSGVPGVPSVALRGAYVRGALRPASRGRGRDRR